jgi:N-acetylated-alpha-linked acidic dipeptidase
MALIHRNALVAACVFLLASRGYSGESEPDFKGFLSDEITAAREWEERFRAIPSPENLREYMRVITEEPHIAGLPGSKRVAEYILSKFQSFGLNAWIEETQALMPLPTERYLELLAPESYVAKLEEPAIAEDKDSADPGQLPTYNAYAGEGDVEAQVVYANYGTPEDYESWTRWASTSAGRSSSPATAGAGAGSRRSSPRAGAPSAASSTRIPAMTATSKE